MVKSILTLGVNSVRALVTNIRALFIFTTLYALLLVSFYIFVSTREATVWQVLVTYAFLILVPAQFFVLQGAIIDRTRDLKFAWKQVLRDALKIFVATIPILIIGWILWLLVNKLQGRYSAPLPPFAFESTPPKPQPIHWPTMLITTLRFLIFGGALPLAAIHLWIEVTAREVRAMFAGGAKVFLKRIGNTFARAFAADSVFIYGLGLIVFGLIPYAVLFIPITIKGTKTDFAVFILRLVLVFVFTLVGWIGMVATLVRYHQDIPEPEVVATPAPAEAPA